MDDVELIAGDGSNLVLTADHGDLGRHGFGRRVRISGTAVCEWTGRLGANRRSIEGRAGTSRSELPACERQGSGFPFSHDTGFREPLDLRSNGCMA